MTRPRTQAVIPPVCGNCRRGIVDDMLADACAVCGHDCHSDCLIEDHETRMLICLACNDSTGTDTEARHV